MGVGMLIAEDLLETSIQGVTGRLCGHGNTMPCSGSRFKRAVVHLALRRE